MINEQSHPEEDNTATNNASTGNRGGGEKRAKMTERRTYVPENISQWLKFLLTVPTFAVLLLSGTDQGVVRAQGPENTTPDKEGETTETIQAEAQTVREGANLFDSARAFLRGNDPVDTFSGSHHQVTSINESGKFSVVELEIRGEGGEIFDTVRYTVAPEDIITVSPQTQEDDDNDQETLEGPEPTNPTIQPLTNITLTDDEIDQFKATFGDQIDQIYSSDPDVAELLKNWQQGTIDLNIVVTDDGSLEPQLNPFPNVKTISQEFSDLLSGLEGLDLSDSDMETIKIRLIAHQGSVTVIGIVKLPGETETANSTFPVGTTFINAVDAEGNPSLAVLETGQVSEVSIVDIYGNESLSDQEIDQVLVYPASSVLEIFNNFPPQTRELIEDLDPNELIIIATTVPDEDGNSKVMIFLTSPDQEMVGLDSGTVLGLQLDNDDRNIRTNPDTKTNQPFAVWPDNADSLLKTTDGKPVVSPLWKIQTLIDFLNSENEDANYTITMVDGVPVVTSDLDRGLYGFIGIETINGDPVFIYPGDEFVAQASSTPAVEQFVMGPGANLNNENTNSDTEVTGGTGTEINQQATLDPSIGRDPVPTPEREDKTGNEAYNLNTFSLEREQSGSYILRCSRGKIVEINLTLPNGVIIPAAVECLFNDKDGNLTKGLIAIGYTIGEETILPTSHTFEPWPWEGNLKFLETVFNDEISSSEGGHFTVTISNTHRTNAFAANAGLEWGVYGNQDVSSIINSGSLSSIQLRHNGIPVINPDEVRPR